MVSASQKSQATSPGEMTAPYREVEKYRESISLCGVREALPGTRQFFAGGGRGEDALSCEAETS